MGGSLLGDFKLARMKAPSAGGTKMVRCVWDGFVTAHLDLIPDSELIPCHVISGTCTR